MFYAEDPYIYDTKFKLKVILFATLKYGSSNYKQHSLTNLFTSLYLELKNESCSNGI